MSLKVDETGKYVQFRGLTIVSAVKRDEEVWENCNRALSESLEITRFYAPLFRESYHMTTTMLDNEYRLGKSVKWESDVSDRLSEYQELYRTLVSQNIRPLFTVRKVHVGGTIRLCGTIDEESETKIFMFANRFKLTSFLPREWHITLAYNYSRISRHEKAAVAERVKFAFTGLFANNTFALDVASLCYHNDMTCFTPWDGSCCPFLR